MIKINIFIIDYLFFKKKPNTIRVLYKASNAQKLMEFYIPEVDCKY